MRSLSPLIVSICLGCSSGSLGPEPFDAGVEDAGTMEAEASVVDAGVDAPNDVELDAHSICCVVDPKTTKCSSYIYGCIFTCGKGSDDLTDIPWIAFDPAGNAGTCFTARYGDACHSVDGDGVVAECN